MCYYANSDIFTCERYDIFTCDGYQVFDTGENLVSHRYLYNKNCYINAQDSINYTMLKAILKK